MTKRRWSNDVQVTGSNSAGGSVNRMSQGEWLAFAWVDVRGKRQFHRFGVKKFATMEAAQLAVERWLDRKSAPRTPRKKATP